MPERTCSRCAAKYYAKGFCRRHYNLARANPDRVRRRNFRFPVATSMAEFILRRIEIDPATECWLWFGSTVPQGYGYARWGDVSTPAHRAAWAEFVGPIPDGLELDHLCRNRGCVNPDHLEPVTHAENVRRSPILRAGAGGSLLNRAKTHCPQGHPYDEANTVVYGGRRQCIACRTARNRARCAARAAA